LDYKFYKETLFFFGVINFTSRNPFFCYQDKIFFPYNIRFLCTLRWKQNSVMRHHTPNSRWKENSVMRHHTPSSSNFHTLIHKLN
jgi:hypothetical protein